MGIARRNSIRSTISGPASRGGRTAVAALALLLLPQGCDSQQAQVARGQGAVDDSSSPVALAASTSVAGGTMLLLGSEYKLETVVRVGAACEILRGIAKDGPQDTRFSKVIVSGAAMTSANKGSGFGQAAFMADLLHHGSPSAAEWRDAIKQAVDLFATSTSQDVKDRMDLSKMEFRRMFLAELPDTTLESLAALTDDQLGEASGVFAGVNGVLETCAQKVDEDGVEIVQESKSNNTVSNYCLSRAKLDKTSWPTPIYVVSSHHHAYGPAACFQLEGNVDSHAYYRCEISNQDRRKTTTPLSDPLNISSFTKDGQGCMADERAILKNCSANPTLPRAQVIDAWCKSYTGLVTTTIKGTVKSSTGTVLTGVRVAALDLKGELVGVAWSKDQDGTFEIEGLLPASVNASLYASYQLVVSKSGYQTAQTSTAPGSTGIQVSLTKLRSPDVNGDGAINMSDVVLVAAAFNTNAGDAKYVEEYDLNYDGAINMSDIVIIAGKFNTLVSE